MTFSLLRTDCLSYAGPLLRVSTRSVRSVHLVCVPWEVLSHLPNRAHGILESLVGHSALK